MVINSLHDTISAYVFFQIDLSICPDNVLPALCTDSACPPGISTCQVPLRYPNNPFGNKCNGARSPKPSSLTSIASRGQKCDAEKFSMRDTVLILQGSHSPSHLHHHLCQQESNRSSFCPFHTKRSNTVLIRGTGSDLKISSSCQGKRIITWSSVTGSCLVHMIPWLRTFQQSVLLTLLPTSGFQHHCLSLCLRNDEFQQHQPLLNKSMNPLQKQHSWPPVNERNHKNDKHLLQNTSQSALITLPSPC